MSDIQKAHDELLAIVSEFLDRGWTSLELNAFGYHIQLHRSNGSPVALETPSTQPTEVPGTSPVSPAQPAHEVAARPQPEPPSSEASAGAEVIVAPMMGTFYRASSPGAAPFVEEGAEVDIGQTICIIEVMKLMSELRSNVSGRVIEILATNGDLVTEGQPLFKVVPNGL